ncbi:FAD-dependent monooxygenase [Erythrobacter sp. G21629-S1]|jgi:3-(3-hydroxy-phenyl)propionate hydroxylase|nr:FAD-dependent monooxygenase [Erythrobacter sp. G21629-S1]
MAASKFADIPVHKRKAPTACGEPGERAPIVLVGGGPVGLTAALDLGRRGHDVVVLNQFDFIPAGSKAICYAKRTLDIWNRLGVVDRILDKGVIWNVGKVFHGGDPEPIYEFDMLPDKGQQMPGFVNIQQYWVEDFLVDELEPMDNVDLRWGHEVVGFDSTTNTVTVDATLGGSYTIAADWLLACDGARSKMREFLGLEFTTRVFEDNFLIADVKFADQRPSERWFWFDPPWGGASALLHKQPDDVWRLDFQLGWDVDKAEAIKPENVEPYVKGMIGDDLKFDQEWYSVYTFQCGRLEKFVHDRVIFLGDSAQLVSPFGARGFNGGIAEAENLAWKLDAVLSGKADASLLETYNEEAIAIADENILNSTRSTDFLTPKSTASRSIRNAVLELARDHAFARPFVNSGRLSTPVTLPHGSLVIEDRDEWDAGIPPGRPVTDMPTEDGWLLKRIGGGWSLLCAGPVADAPVPVIELDKDLAKQRFGLTNGGAYLIRPDRYVASRWKHFDAERDLKGMSLWA